jgi:putative transposase
VLARVIGRRGAPTRLRSDNSSEFLCAAVQGWLPGAGTQSISVTPGSPWENGYIESFKRRSREEFLNGEEFETVADARSKGGGGAASTTPSGRTVP